MSHLVCNDYNKPTYGDSLKAAQSLKVFGANITQRESEISLADQWAENIKKISYFTNTLEGFYINKLVNKILELAKYKTNNTIIVAIALSNIAQILEGRLYGSYLFYKRVSSNRKIKSWIASPSNINKAAGNLVAKGNYLMLKDTQGYLAPVANY